MSAKITAKERIVRVLVVSQYWAPEYGVPQRRWGWLAELMKSEGHEVVVLTPPPHYLRNLSFKEWLSMGGLRVGRRAEVGPAGESIFRTPFFPAGRSLTQRAVNQLFVATGAILGAVVHRRALNGKIDVVIGTVPALPTLIASRVISWLLKTPYAIDLRDAWPDLLHEHKKWNFSVGKPSLRERIFRFGPAQLVIAVTEIIMNNCLRHSAGIISTSSLLLEKLRRTEQLSLAAQQLDKGVVIRNVFPPGTGFEKKYYYGGDSVLRVLYAGTVGRAQNLGNILDALEILRKDGINIELRIIGEGATKQQLQRQSRALDLPVSFLGRVKPDELDEHYDWADTALVHLAAWPPLRMAIPSKIYELMEMGMHISGVLDGEAAFLVRHLEAGFTVKPEDPAALAEAWRNLARNRRSLEIGDLAKDWVRQERNLRTPIILENFVRALRGKNAGS